MHGPMNVKWNFHIFVIQKVFVLPTQCIYVSYSHITNDFMSWSSLTYSKYSDDGRVRLS